MEASAQQEFDDLLSNNQSLLKYTVTENFGLVTKTLKQATTTLYSNAIDISRQGAKGQIAAVFAGDQEFDELRIIKKIGQGGFSEVF